jgi:hypothetical protein
VYRDENLELRGRSDRRTEKLHTDELQGIHFLPKVIYSSGLVCLIFESLRSHMDAPHSIGFLYPTTQNIPIDTHPYIGGVRKRNPSKRTVADSSLRPRGDQNLLPWIKE